MSNPAATHAPVVPAKPRRTGSATATPDLLAQIERAVAKTLAQIKPGARGAAGALASRRRSLLANSMIELRPNVSASALNDLLERTRPSPLIEAALQKATHAHVAALRRAGLDASIIEVLRSWVEVTVDARALQRQIEVQRVIDSVQGEIAAIAPDALEEDPAKSLSAAELGKALGGLGDETVRQRERAGVLFSVLRPGRKRGREYPAFQAWPGVAGEPLERALAALGPVSGVAAYGFFTSPTDLLGGLTPIEALVGRLTARRVVDAETPSLLAAPASQRLDAVEKAAQAHAAALTA